ncbi:MAG: 16S rRNA (guanine(966)-N(2))-methyltransferase RsmD [Deltaproteobacteria bacterium]|nr:16S rRNA (guanine(966)-N(2))-methyltransferase RsmD [Deltaproteobacteria bacterium]
MRITGGEARGRHLVPLKGISIRPTSDRVREAVFNLIGQDLAGLRVLDLFAGTGSLGIEALSRGALRALFIDHSRQSLVLIRRNLKRCGYEDSGVVIRKDLSRGLPWGNRLMQKGFDLVFIDPPYGRNMIPPLLEEFSGQEVLGTEAFVVAQSSRDDRLPEKFGPMRLVNRRTYGETKLDIYEYGSEP